jgi:aspartate aminotransferase-like enzyme
LTGPEINLRIPGPTALPPSVREAGGRQMINHRGPEFKDLLGRLQAGMKPYFGTTGDIAILSCAGTGGLEAAVVNTLSPGDRVLAVSIGAFGDRFAKIAEAYGASVDRVAAEWGWAAAPDEVRERLGAGGFRAVLLTHNETSTGVMNPIPELAAAIKRAAPDALILVDTVSSLGGAPVETDGWGLDVALAGTQKALAVPPGLAVFALSARAAERAGGVSRRGYYTDLLRYRDKHREGGTITTPALPLVYALDLQLGRLLAEGMEARWERHRALAARTAEWAAARGFRFAPKEGVRSPTVSCLRPPEGVAAPELVKKLAQRGFTVGGGYGDWKPTTFRIGHMGEVRLSDLELLLQAIDEVAAECNAS